MTSKYAHTDRDIPVNQVETVTLDPNQRAVIEYQLSETRSQFFLEQLAVTQTGDTSYKAALDGQDEYGPAAVPPTELNDNSPTFGPPKQFSSTMTVEVENLHATKTKTYHIRVKGWERPRTSSEGGL